MKPSLHVVEDTPPPPAFETVAERVRRLQTEARGLARDHVTALCLALDGIEILAREIAEGGDAYPPGVRDLCRRLSDDCLSKANTLSAIVTRNA